MDHSLFTIKKVPRKKHLKHLNKLLKNASQISRLTINLLIPKRLKPMPMDRSRYPKNWDAIALRIKNLAGWQCQRCGLECLAPGQTKANNKSIDARRTLTVHHINYTPEDCSDENLIALCSGCHLWYHRYQRGNVSPGQLELFQNSR